MAQYSLKSYGTAFSVNVGNDIDGFQYFDVYQKATLQRMRLRDSLYQLDFGNRSLELVTGTDTLFIDGVEIDLTDVLIAAPAIASFFNYCCTSSMAGVTTLNSLSGAVNLLGFGYDQQISGQDITTVRDPNVIGIYEGSIAQLFADGTSFPISFPIAKYNGDFLLGTQIISPGISTPKAAFNGYYRVSFSAVLDLTGAGVGTDALDLLWYIQSYDSEGSEFDNSPLEQWTYQGAALQGELITRQTIECNYIIRARADGFIAAQFQQTGGIGVNMPVLNRQMCIEYICADPNP